MSFSIIASSATVYLAPSAAYLAPSASYLQHVLQFQVAHPPSVLAPSLIEAFARHKNSSFIHFAQIIHGS